MAKVKRTTHLSSKGTKLYAVRDSKGRFKDIQTYKRAHSADLRHKQTTAKKGKTTDRTTSTGPRVSASKDK